MVEPPHDPMPQMQFDQPVFCAFLEPSKAVPSGQFRVQCDDKARVCLASPTHVLLDTNAGLVEGPEPLARVNDCIAYGGAFDAEAKSRAGYRFVSAIAEAPPGWYRDEQGRVYQVNFDLNRRVYFGGAYTPTFEQPTGGPLGAVSVANNASAVFGIAVEIPGDDEFVLNRLHILETEVVMGPRFWADTTLVRFDWSASRNAPFLWITTFVGKPSRHDLAIDAGAWFEAMHLEALTIGGSSEVFLTLGAACLTLDLWHSTDLVSYLRVRAGPALELDGLRHFTSVKPEVALEGDWTFDRDGFNHAHFSAEAEKLFLDPSVDGRVQNPERLRIKLGVERILIAVNDYPLSLVLDGRATYRDDLPEVPAGWEFAGEAGLRFSFWAPARRTAAPQTALR